MLLEIKTKESTEYIEADRVEDTDDKVYYDRNGINVCVVKNECEAIIIYRHNGFAKVLHMNGK